MEKFVARSGREVKVSWDGSVFFEGLSGYLSRAAAMDAEEWAQAKRDAERGWWRSPVDPHIVCIEGPVAESDGGRRTVYVFDEKKFERFWLNDRVLDEHHTAPQRAARDFLLAHPVVRPWHDAQRGQFWRVTHNGMVEVCRVDDVDGGLRFVGVQYHTSVSMPVTHPSITAAVHLVEAEPSSQAGLQTFQGHQL